MRLFGVLLLVCSLTACPALFGSGSNPAPAPAPGTILTAVPSSWNGLYATQTDPYTPSLSIHDGVIYRVYTYGVDIMEIQLFPAPEPLTSYYTHSFSENECRASMSGVTLIRYTRNPATRNIVEELGFSVTTYIPYIELAQVATPVFNPGASQVSAGTSVTMSCITEGATIHYTIDGSVPTTSSPTGISYTVDSTTTISAIAVKEGMRPSATASAYYWISGTAQQLVQTPTLSPPPGTVASGTTVTFDCATPGATIRFTTDGSVPTASSPASTSYPITTTTNLRIAAFLDGMTPSAVADGTYYVSTAAPEQVGTPTFSVAEGTVAAGTVVSFLSSTAGATFHYTVDGSTPTASSPSGSSFTVNSTVTLRVIAVKAGMLPSEVASRTYTVSTIVTVPPTVGVLTPLNSQVYSSHLIPPELVSTIGSEITTTWLRAYNTGLNLGAPIGGGSFAGGLNRGYMLNYVQRYTIDNLMYVIAFDFTTNKAYLYRDPIIGLMINQGGVYGLPQSDEYYENTILYQDWTFGRIALSLDSSGVPTSFVWELDPAILPTPTLYANVPNDMYSPSSYFQGAGTVVLGSPVPGTWAAGVVVRYTTDGTTPTSSSSLWPLGGVTVAEGATVTVKVRAFDGTGKMSPVVTRFFRSFPKVAGEMVPNGDFAYRAAAWSANGNGAGNVARGSYDIVKDAFKVQVDNGGSADWNVMCITTPKLTIKGGYNYKLAIEAWADAPRTIYPAIQEYGVDSNGNGGLWDRHFSGTASLTTVPQTFTYYFTANGIPTGESDPYAVLNVMGGGSDIDYYISRASLVEIGEGTPNAINLNYIHRIALGSHRSTTIEFGGSKTVWGYFEIPQEAAGATWNGSVVDTVGGIGMDFYGPDSMTMPFEVGYPDTIFPGAGIYYVKFTALNRDDGSTFGSVTMSIWQK